MYIVMALHGVIVALLAFLPGRIGFRDDVVSSVYR